MLFLRERMAWYDYFWAAENNWVFLVRFLDDF